MIGWLFAIKEWLLCLHIGDKMIGSIVSLFTGSMFKRICNKQNQSTEEKAFKKALKRWNTHFYVKGFYKKNRMETIHDYCQYVINHHGVYDDDIDRLYRYFEEELDKTSEGRQFLQDLRIKALNKDVYEGLMMTQEVLDELKSQHEMLKEIKQALNTHNKGKREFEEIKGYIKRTCSPRLKRKDYLSYILENHGIGRFRLIDIVSGRTECKGNKFVLYSDAQTGKTTELLELGWELQEEKQLTPILFKVRGCHSIKQELPFLRNEIEKGLVVIIDALDEKFEGDARFDMYHEIETYADEHPQQKIIVTCRENFSGEFSFEGFAELVLNDLSWKDATNHIESVGLSEIIPEIEKRKLYEFVRTPFYLLALIDFYKGKHVLPENRGELYNYFIERRLEQEENLRLKQSSEMTSRGKTLLQKMAVGMQLMGLSHISKEDLLCLLDNKYDDYNRILRSGLIEAEEENGYGFTHNSFKEYFVSRYLLDLGGIKRIQELCCYSNTRIVRTGWSNTVALLLSQLPKKSGLSQQILRWIVEDNKELILYIDRKLLDIEERTAIFKDILEWHKKKDLRFADLGTSRYEDLMDFGSSTDSIDYLMTELRACKEINCHTVNVLFLIHYLSQKEVSTSKAKELKDLLLSVLSRFKDDDEHIYIFFEVFRNKWLKSEISADDIYNIIKGSEHPNIVNHFVGYITETGCAEKYVDYIIEKGKYIQTYRKDGYSRIIRRGHLYDAYLALTSWESVKRALEQMKTEYEKHLISSVDEKEYEETLGEMMRKVAKMRTEHPEVADYVYEMMLEMAEERDFTRKMEEGVFLSFFEESGLSQEYFDKSAETLDDYFIKNNIEVKNYKEHRKIEGTAYFIAKLLNEERLEQIASSLDYTNPNGDSMLSCIGQFAAEEMQKEIDIIRKNRYPQFWRDKNAPSRWQIEAQRDYDELMDYERFKRKIIMILDEKSTKNKADMRELSHAKMKFSDKEEETISSHVISIFYRYYSDKEDSYDIEGIRDFIEDDAEYQKLVVVKTGEVLYGENERVKVSKAQKAIFKDATLNWLKALANEPYRREYYHEHPAITVLLKHDVTAVDDLLFQLLPYSSCHIYIRGEGYTGRNYSLFNYICERCADNPNFLSELRSCMDKPVEYDPSNWKTWCVYLVKNGVTSEYERAINIMLSLPSADPSLSIAVSLLENPDTRPLVLRKDVLERCDEEKRLFIFEQLCPDPSMDKFVRTEIEKDFGQMSEESKRRATCLLLMKGSVRGLEYAIADPSIIRTRANLKGYNVEALPLLMTLYSKAIDQLNHSEYIGILNPVEAIAEATDEGWSRVSQLFDDMIKQDEKKFLHLNWYLRDWDVKRMEKASPVMGLEKVKELLSA